MLLQAHSLITEYSTSFLQKILYRLAALGAYTLDIDFLRWKSLHFPFSIKKTLTMMMMHDDDQNINQRHHHLSQHDLDPAFADISLPGPR